jgi:anti-sigma factor RsiW
MDERHHPGDVLSAYVDGALTEDQAAAVAAHLDRCPACAAERDEVADARRILRSLPLIEPPPGVLVPAPAVHLADAISAWLDRELDAVAAEGVAAHLDACPACAAERDEVAWARDRVRLLPPVEPPASLLTPDGLFSLGTAAGRRRAWGAVAVAAAAVVIGGMGLTTRADDTPTARPTFASFVADHSTASPSPDPVTGLAPVAVPVSFSP